MRTVKSIEDLLSITKTDSIELANDIDCKGKHIPKLCSIFRGIIEGNNHTISNLVIEDTVWGDEQKIALFSYLTHARIRNIRFENIKYIINNGVYTPKVAGLGIDVADTELENITMTVSTSNGECIPLIYDSIGGEHQSLKYICNDADYKKYQYKEGSFYEGIN